MDQDESPELNNLMQRLMDVLDAEIPWEERFRRKVQEDPPKI